MGEPSARGRQDAVVIGGGLAGMLALTALLGHVDSVTVVERDRYPTGHTFRKGVPQARHLHILLSGGQQALDRLLPGTVQALTAAGARRLYLPRDLLTRMPTGWQRRFDERRHTCVSVTRPVLDGVVRDRALRAAAGSPTRVEVLEATEAIGLTGDARQVTGVRVRSRGSVAAGAPAERELPATLVVDASGRGSRAPQWYAALGLPAPREVTVDSGIAYATRMFRPRDPAAAPDAGVNVPGRPDCPRGAAYLPVEDGTWLLTLSGVRGHHPPTDEDAFARFTTTLGDPYVHRLLADAEPVSPVHGFRDTSNRRRHFERPGALPEGLVVLGDAHCTFNPVYGQGMSVAALGAYALRTALEAAGGPYPGFAGNAQRAVARATDPAWLAAVGADRPYVDADRTKAGLGERLSTWYVDRLTARAAIDPVVGAAFRDVFCLTAPPARLAAPRIALRTLLLPRKPALPSPPLTVEPVRGDTADLVS
ncbi:FAD-dependent monooxygenase [Streptomyces sp. MST-110588]|uniref:NAD(P)/FAD-dependent oxidoreductase n=1 Tax=Streptomyces sp. MST-110588 TaxID=2833628 RepID=UPI001F5DB2B0|nr:FAD-dependent monooxygenase [Streptomyces sp. MST-110588]UNO43116.1 FAD-dependent monooxygenase [Streptomyces sp. MST-110588]